jgi:hypothetical protein
MLSSLLTDLLGTATRVAALPSWQVVLPAPEAVDNVRVWLQQRGAGGSLQRCLFLAPFSQNFSPVFPHHQVVEQEEPDGEADVQAHAALQSAVTNAASECESLPLLVPSPLDDTHPLRSAPPRA